MRSRGVVAGLVCLALGGGLPQPAAGAGDKRPRTTPQLERADSTAAPESLAGGTSRDAGRRKTLAYDLVRFGRDVRIHADEIVRGDVVLLGGDLRVEGEIQGGAVVLGGNLELDATARVGGPALAVGGRVDAAPGADVEGRITSLGFFPKPLLGGFDWRHAQRVAALVADVAKLLLLLLVVAIAGAVVPARLDRARRALATGLLPCLGLGVLALTGGLFAVVMLFVLLAITLVGLPVAFALGAATGLLLLVSLTVGVRHLGRLVGGAVGRPLRGSWTAAAIGIATVMTPELVADAVRVGNPEATAFGLVILHGVLAGAVLAAGLGALLSTRLGARPALVPAVASPGGAAPVAAPPPPAGA